MLMLLLLLLASPIFGQQQSVSQLVNPSFEQCTNGVPDGWVQGGSSQTGQPTAVCSTDYAHSGNNSALFLPFSVNQVGEKSTYISQVSQMVAFLEAGQPITLSYWVFFAGVPAGADSSSTGSYNFSVTYNNDQNSVINIFPEYVPGTGTAATNFFYQFATTFNAPSNGKRGGNLTITFYSDKPSIMIYVDDVSLTAPSVVGDPQFVGLRGQSYQVHGIDGEYYNLVTDQRLQINSKFVYLSSGKCPIIKLSHNATKNIAIKEQIKQSRKNCWSHPGSYLGEIGIQQFVGDHLAQLHLVSGSATQGFLKVRINGQLMAIGDIHTENSGSDRFAVNYVSTHQVSVKLNQFAFLFDNSDLFINQAVRPLVPLSTLTCHGLFGQTHTIKKYKTALKHIAGRVDDYMLEDHSIWGTKFMYNLFNSTISN